MLVLALLYFGVGLVVLLGHSNIQPSWFAYWVLLCCAGILAVLHLA